MRGGIPTVDTGPWKFAGGAACTYFIPVCLQIGSNYYQNNNSLQLRQYFHQFCRVNISIITSLPYIKTNNIDSSKA